MASMISVIFSWVALCSISLGSPLLFCMCCISTLWVLDLVPVHCCYSIFLQLHLRVLSTKYMKLPESSRPVENITENRSWASIQDFRCVISGWALCMGYHQWLCLVFEACALTVGSTQQKVRPALIGNHELKILYNF